MTLVFGLGRGGCDKANCILERITFNPDSCNGKPVVKGTCITVQMANLIRWSRWDEVPALDVARIG